MPEPPPASDTGLEPYLGREIVIDTDSSFVIIGKLIAIGPDYLTLEAVDVHDGKDAKSTRDHYVMETGKLGTRSNRRGTKVRVAHIVSVSLLDDIETW